MVRPFSASQIVETNRSTGYSGSLLAPYSVDPGFLRTEALREAKQLTWQIDKQKGVATLESSEYKGPPLELPLRPMLGCIGTAPANNAVDKPMPRSAGFVDASIILVQRAVAF